MQILVIADDDVVLSSVPEQRCDVLVSCGDLPDEIILKVAERVRCRRILAVKGNHDSSGAFHPRITDLHLQTVSIDGITFGGFGGSWKYKPKGHFLYEQQEVDAALESFPRVDVFVAHNSPNGIHDQADDVHIGVVAPGLSNIRSLLAVFLQKRRRECQPEWGAFHLNVIMQLVRSVWS